MTKSVEASWFPIQTERLRLREFRADDYEDLHAYASDLETVRFMDWGPNTPQISRERLDLMLTEQANWPPLLEKLGMRREGTLRKNRQVRDGWRDTHLYAMLDTEWSVRRPEGS